MIIVLLLGTATAAWGAGREIKISLIEYSVDKSDMQPSLSPTGGFGSSGSIRR